MIVKHLSCCSLIWALVVVACGSPAQQPSPDSTEGVAATSETPSAQREIQGWWDLGDSFGPFAAFYEGNTLVRVEETLGHGDYGNTKADYHYQDGKLARYTQESQLRLMDPDNPQRLVPVSFDMVFDPDGVMVTSHKTIDRTPTAFDPLDEDRIRGHARTLEEKALTFANAYDLGEAPIRFICGEDETFDVVFYPDGVVLDLGPFEGRYILEHVPSGSGAKYSDGVMTLWTKGEEAFVERGSGRILSDCIGAT